MPPLHVPHHDANDTLKFPKPINETVSPAMSTTGTVAAKTEETTTTTTTIVLSEKTEFTKLYKNVSMESNVLYVLSHERFEVGCELIINPLGGREEKNVIAELKDDGV